MTVTADTAADAGQEAVAERVRKIREAQDAGVSRAEGWRRRGPLLPALIFMIVVTQIPFLFTLYYSTLSWNWFGPAPASSSDCRTTSRSRKTASSGGWASTPSS